MSGPSDEDDNKPAGDTPPVDDNKRRRRVGGPVTKGGDSRASKQMFERVKTARGRKTSSKNWLQRQLNDPYVKKAQMEGYRSRAAYKLIELDERFHFIKPGMRIVDLGSAPADGVISDLAPWTTGHKNTDHVRIVGLVELAALFAFETLKPGGFFIAKVFQGGAEGELLEQLKQKFAKVRHFKPASSRSESAETFLIAMGFKG